MNTDALTMDCAAPKLFAARTMVRFSIPPWINFETSAGIACLPSWSGGLDDFRMRSGTRRLVRATS